MAIRRKLTKMGRALLPEALKRLLRRRIQQGVPMPLDLDFGLFEENGSFHARLPGGARIQIPPEILAEFRSNFENDWDEMKAFLEVAEKARVLFDVGADKGVLAASFTALGKNKRAFAYEPSPSGCASMRELFSLNGLADQIEIVSKVVGKRSERVAFSQEDCGYVQVVPVASAEEVEAECVSLDDECERLGFAPDLVKIDVEGAEEQVVAGMYQTLARHQPALLLELHGLDCAKPTLALLDALDYGYRDARSAATFASGADVCKRFGDTVFQIVGVPGGAVGA